MFNLNKKIILVLPLCLLLSACGGIPEDALKLSPTTLEDRQIQGRRFETSEIDLLAASAGVIQDLGYTIEESDTKLGVIVASKTSDATDSKETALNIMSILFTGKTIITDNVQKIRLSLVTKPTENDANTAVRLTLQRVVWNTAGGISRAEYINDPKYYQDFYSKLSKSVFLDAHEI